MNVTEATSNDEQTFRSAWKDQAVWSATADRFKALRDKWLGDPEKENKKVSKKGSTAVLVYPGRGVVVGTRHRHFAQKGSPC